MKRSGLDLFAIEATSSQMKRVLFGIFIGVVAMPAFAQTAPSETQQRLACMGDALRLCSQYIPDREQIRLCMAAQHAALSAGCRPVFDASMKALSVQKPK